MGFHARVVQHALHGLLEVARGFTPDALNSGRRCPKLALGTKGCVEALADPFQGITLPQSLFSRETSPSGLSQMSQACILPNLEKLFKAKDAVGARETGLEGRQFRKIPVQPDLQAFLKL